MAMASNQTSNYGLCQWEETDLVMRTDFNEDNQKIDTALKNLQTSVNGKASSSTVSSLSSRVSNLESTRATVSDVENLSLECAMAAWGSYTGTGKYGSGNWTQLSFSTSLNRTPALVIVRPMEDSGQGLVIIQGMKSCTCNVSGNIGTGSTVTVSWSGQTVRWYAPSATAQMNDSGVKYCWFAVG